MYQAGEFIVYGTNSVPVESPGKAAVRRPRRISCTHAGTGNGHGDHLYSDGFAGVYPSGDLPRKSRGTHQLYS